MKKTLLYCFWALSCFLNLPLLAQEQPNTAVCVHLTDGKVDIFPSHLLASKEETATQWKFKMKTGKVLVYGKDEVAFMDSELPVDTTTFTSFKFNNLYNENVYKDVYATIHPDEITATVGAIGKSLTPSFRLSTSNVSVYVGNELQVSKVSRHRFDKPVVYTLAIPNYRILERLKIKDEVWSDSVPGRAILEPIPLTSEMISTNAPSNFENSEGLSKAIDGNPNTFFHSTWGENGPHHKLPLDQCPFIEVKLAEAVDSFAFSYITRSDSPNYNPRILDWEYSSDGVDWKLAKRFSEQDGMPMTGAKVSYQSPVIALPGKYKHLRLKMVEGSHKNYLVLSELALYACKGTEGAEPPHLISPAVYVYQWRPYGKDIPVKVEWLTDQTTRVPTLHIDIEHGQEVQGKERYYKASFKLDGAGVFPNMEDSALIRGRGNITLNYPKKSYRLKFSQAVKPFDLKKGKNWVLLANYQQGAMLANVVGMKIARRVGTVAANDMLPVELYVNGSYRGSYNFTQQVGLHNNSVDIDETNAFMLELDSYYDEGNFVEPSFNVTANIKDPDPDDFPDMESAKERYDLIKTDFKTLTRELREGEDMEPSIHYPMLARYLLVNELIENYELRHPKSCFLYREDLFSIGSKYVFGPVWDLDWAYGYNDTQTCCDSNPETTYFDHFHGAGGEFYLALRRMGTSFDRAYYKVWKHFMDEELDEVIAYIDDYYAYVRPSFEHNNQLWGTGHEYRSTADKFKYWVKQRAEFLFQNLKEFDLEVPAPIRRCDVNLDGAITLADAICLQNELLELPNETYDAKQADANEDGLVNVTDIVWVIAEAMNQDPDDMRMFQLPAAEAHLTACHFSAALNQMTEMPLTLHVAQGNYVAAQFDVTLPEGLVLSDLVLPEAWSKHHTELKALGEGRYRVFIWADQNGKLPVGEADLQLWVQSDRTIPYRQRVVSIDHMVLVNALGEDERVSGKSATFDMEVTGIHENGGNEAVSGGKTLNIETLTDGEIEVYSLDGRLLKRCAVRAGKNRIALPVGVYLVNRQKVVINN